MPFFLVLNVVLSFYGMFWDLCLWTTYLIDIGYIYTQCQEHVMVFSIDEHTFHSILEPLTKRPCLFRLQQIALVSSVVDEIYIVFYICSYRCLCCCCPWIIMWASIVSELFKCRELFCYIIDWLLDTEKACTVWNFTILLLNYLYCIIIIVVRIDGGSCIITGYSLLQSKSGLRVVVSMEMPDRIALSYVLPNTSYTDWVYIKCIEWVTPTNVARYDEESPYSN